MPECRLCGDEHRSYKALESHWKREHKQKFQKQNSQKTGRNLAVTNLLQQWKQKTEDASHPATNSA